MIASTVDPSNEENWSVVAGGAVDVIVTAMDEEKNQSTENATLDEFLYRGIEYRARQTLSLTRGLRPGDKRGRQMKIGFVVKNKEQTRKTNQKQKEMK